MPGVGTQTRGCLGMCYVFDDYLLDEAKALLDAIEA
jgi:hypothetical protein